MTVASDNSPWETEKGVLTQISAKWRTCRIKRERNAFLSLYDFPEKGSLLDVSCGTGDFFSRVQAQYPPLELHGIDCDPRVIAHAQERFPKHTFSVGRAESLQYADGMFEAVVCRMSFHHYPDPLRVLSEIERVLATTGVFYLMDLMPHSRITQVFSNIGGCDEPYHFERYYRVEEIIALASESGLCVRSETKQRFSSARLIAFTKGHRFPTS